jgi:Leucine carboxyl methyltransferase
MDISSSLQSFETRTEVESEPLQCPKIVAAQNNTINMASSSSPDSIPKPASAGIKLEKNAGLIMGTNNSSIVSKRSVERLYYPKPHFFQHFVRKPQRRSPTINRGYWLRMQAVDTVVKEFLQRPSTKQKVVLNLGCG